MGCAGSKPAIQTQRDQLSPSTAATSVGDVPAVYYASGAALPEANGCFVRDGDYQGAPLFKNRQYWLLRYMLPSGNTWWYIADKDQLDRDDGDLCAAAT